MAEQTDISFSLRSRPPLSRMLIIHELLRQDEHPNRNELARQLEISSKTIQRDIDFMRDQLGLPIEYDEKKYGYHYTAPVHHFPALQVTEEEIVSIFIAQKALSIYQNTPFEKPLKAALKKLSASLKDRFSFDDLESAFSFNATGADRMDAKTFEIVSRATLGSKELQFMYCRVDCDVPRMRHVRPYHVACVEKQWYLFAFDLDRLDMRTFALCRMKDVEATEKVFQRPEDFSIAKHLGNSFGVRTSSGVYKIRIWFDALAAKFIREKIWHASQEIKELCGGEVELRMTLGSLTEVKRWVLSWGKHAKALGPSELIARMQQDASAIAQYYLG